MVIYRSRQLYALPMKGLKSFSQHWPVHFLA